MPAVAPSPLERVILRDVDWDLYQHLLAGIGESPGTRVTYDNGLLQIRVVSAGHDNPNRALALAVDVICMETGTDVCALGSTTFQRPDLLKGFEPDSCFYFREAAAVRAKDEIRLPDDPPPELVIEVDVTSHSLNRFPIFAAVGVAEVWRYSGGAVSMHRLRDGSYESIPRSEVLPALTAEAATLFVQESRRLPRPEWVELVRRWVRRAMAGEAE